MLFKHAWLIVCLISVFIITANGNTVSEIKNVSATANNSEETNAGDFTHCFICSPADSTLRSTTKVASTSGVVQSCTDWQNLQADFIEADTADCFALQYMFMVSCCNGLPPAYKAQQNVLDYLFHSGDDSYNTQVPPQRQWDHPLNISVQATVSTMSIVDPGFQGGTIFVGGSLELVWEDERLQWDPAVLGATQVAVKASLDDDANIWVPTTLNTEDENNNDNDDVVTTSSLTATVLANGTVTWVIPLQRELSCNIPPYNDPWSRDCSASLGSFPKQSPGDKSSLFATLNFLPQATIVENPTAIPGLVVNEMLSSIDFVATNSHKNNRLTLQIHVDPYVRNCALCGGLPGATLRNDTVPTSQNVEGGGWTTFAPGQIGWTCGQLDEFLQTLPPFDLRCGVGLSYFQDSCCAGVPSRNECENAIREAHLSKTSASETVVPPDPSAANVLNGFQPDGEKVLVWLALDVEQLLGIDIKSNTMEILVSLELLWTDDRLAWTPMTSTSCVFTSYRASVNPEETEIWVPEVDLLNQVEGAQGLPLSHASVYDSGTVWWKRTGVLKVACELTDITNFPFDRPGCYLDFGSSRDAGVHRVQYRPDGPYVEFSDRIIEKTALYQEYHVMTENYNVSLRTVINSGSAKDVVRYQFYFERATRWYMLAFVYLYVMFTFLSFGVFLLDPQSGERLGYGASILFVIVAQDITMSAYTPITMDQLWIDVLSLVCKSFVIGSIMESVIVIFISFQMSRWEDEDSNSNESSITSATAAEKARLMDVLDGNDEEGQDGGEDESIDVDMATEEARNQEQSAIKHHQGRTRPFSLLDACFFCFRPKPPDTKATEGYRYLRYVDSIMFFLFSLSYTIALIVLFGRVGNHEN